MLHYAVVFFVIGLIGSLLGFGDVDGLSAQIGWMFAVVAIIFLAVALLSGGGGRGPIERDDDLHRSLHRASAVTPREWARQPGSNQRTQKILRQSATLRSRESVSPRA